MNEWEFYEELGRVPGPPPDLYGRIQKKVHRKSAVLRSMYAVAAALLLTLGTTGYLMHRHGVEAALAPEVAEEVQFLHNYAAGNDLGQESPVNVLYTADELAQEER